MTIYHDGADTGADTWTILLVLSVRACSTYMMSL